MVSARWRGSCASGASGRPCATSQNGQRRVQMSPRIMKVAVPLPKHSAMFGQEASSHTVCSFCRRRMSLISWKREPGLAARTRIHAGFGSVVARGTMRIVFAFPFSFTPASRMVEMMNYACCQLFAHGGRRVGQAERARLCHGEAGITAGIDGGERREVHVHVERHAMVRPPLDHTDPKGGHLGPVHIDARRTGAAHAAAAYEIDHRLLEQRYEGLDLDAAAREVDERIEHNLAGAVIGHLAATIGHDDGNAIRNRNGRGALPQRIDPRMLEEPELVGSVFGAATRERAHGFESRRVLDPAEPFDDDVRNDGHSTITTPGWSQSSW